MAGVPTSASSFKYDQRLRLSFHVDGIRQHSKRHQKAKLTTLSQIYSIGYIIHVVCQRDFETQNRITINAVARNLERVAG